MQTNILIYYRIIIVTNINNSPQSLKSLRRRNRKDHKINNYSYTRYSLIGYIQIYTDRLFKFSIMHWIEQTHKRFESLHIKPKDNPILEFLNSKWTSTINTDYLKSKVCIFKYLYTQILGNKIDMIILTSKHIKLPVDPSALKAHNTQPPKERAGTCKIS